MANLLTSNSPTIRAIANGTNGDRGTFTVPLADSSVHYFGEFFDPFTGTAGAQTPANNQNITAVLSDIRTYKNGAYVSVGDPNVTNLPGTLVARVESVTAPIPAKYTASASNVSRTYPDIAVYYKLTSDDTFEAELGASGVPTTKGTTTGSGTPNYYIEFDPSYPWMLLESSANSSATGKNMQIVGGVQGKSTRIVAKLINATGANS